MKHDPIAPETIAQWQEDTTARLAAGWQVATIRGQLARGGCPPDIIDQILRTAQGGTGERSGRALRAAIAIGVAVLLLGLAILVFKTLLG